MSRTYRTLMFRILPDKSPYLIKVLKKPTHPKAEKKIGFSSMVRDYSLSMLVASIFYGPKGNYLHLGFEGQNTSGFVADLLAKNILIGQWLSHNTKMPISPGIVAYSLPIASMGTISNHLWLVEDPGRFLVNVNVDQNAILKALPLSGFKYYQHMIEGKVLVHLQLHLDQYMEWEIASHILQSQIQSPFFDLLRKNGLAQASLPPKDILHFVL